MTPVIVCLQGMASILSTNWIGFQQGGWRNGKNQKPSGHSVAFTFPIEATPSIRPKPSSQKNGSKQRPSVAEPDFLERL
jgi:hypothetical protein